jgi:hypothetical protein
VYTTGYMWQEVFKDELTETHRLRIDGGWLYRHFAKHAPPGAVQVVFVPYSLYIADPQTGEDHYAEKGPRVGDAAVE